MLGYHTSYHQSIPGDEAERRLRQFHAHCYLTRFSDRSDCYVLLVYMQQTPIDVMKHFKIIIKDGKVLIDGKDEEFDDISQLLAYYENNRIDPALESIGRNCVEDDYKKMEREKREREEREQREREERERKEREERERKEREQREREEREQREREEREQREREQRERVEREQRERVEREQRERVEREQRERVEREQRERVEREQREREEREREEERKCTMM